MKFFGGRISLPESISTLIAGLGLLLMIASFVWWQSRLRPVAPTAAAGETVAPAPFTLVVLDPGHGGQDSGAMWGGVQEKDLTLDIAQRVDRLLQAQGIATLMTRTGDSYVSLADRAAVTNRAQNCIFVSIHFNEGNKNGSAGVETYYAEHQIADRAPIIAWLPFLQQVSFQTPNVESESLAGFIQESVVARTQEVNRGIKPAQFFVITNVRSPAALVEGGFLSNKDEIGKLTTENYREQMAAGISDGILRYREVLKQRESTLAASRSAGS
jgi:N-acetylmuramoyl-L-alanine amidase